MPDSGARPITYYFMPTSGDSDQTPRSAASDLGLRCLSMSHKKSARRIWVNPI